MRQGIRRPIELLIQADSPGQELEPNWLPAPSGKFILMMRLYWPNEHDPSILDGLLRDRVEFRLAMSITPPLTAMLDDRFHRGKFDEVTDRADARNSRPPTLRSAVK